MNVIDLMFLLQFGILIIITLLKLYNIMRYKTEQGKIYDMKISFLLLILTLIVFGVGFIVFLRRPEELVFLGILD